MRIKGEGERERERERDRTWKQLAEEILKNLPFG